MCGIGGIWKSGGGLDVSAVARKMGSALRHRGPNDGGEWWDFAAGIGLAHRRLSIQDLSPEGHQPMASESGRFVIVFNGEVYNFAELRDALPGVSWRGHSDTEVMLAAFERWGVERSLQRFVGMFAFGLWDRKTRQLYLVRDRLGIKPLYYGYVSGNLVFGSELKAIRATPGFDDRIDRSALTLFMRHGYVPHPYTIFQNVYKLPPAGLLKLSQPNQLGVVETYWSAREVAENGITRPASNDPRRAVDEFERLLTDAVGLRMLSDVPVGAFLSGGVDSSTVVALMQSLSGNPVRTFSIGFKEPDYNEAPHAAAVARHLGTQHTELYVTPAQAQSVVPKLPQIYDEPFADASQVPTYLVSQLAGQSVTVALSGDGGDELFAGYPRYALTARAWSIVKRLPYGIRAAASRLLEMPTAAVWDSLLRHSAPFFPGIWRARHPAAQIERIANVLRQKSLDLLYRSMVSHWDRPGEIIPGHDEPLTALTDRERQIAHRDPILRLMYADLVSYLPDDILTKVDRASMAVGLEVRVPLLDHRVVEFAWRLPIHLRAGHGGNKWLLRQVLYKHVPSELFARPKMGFGIPVGEWMRGSLRDWAEDLLAPKAIAEDGFFSPSVVSRTWREHLTHERNHHYRLWIVLMFQAWYRQLRTSDLDGSPLDNRIETAVNGPQQLTVTATRSARLAGDLFPNIENAAL